MTIEPPTSSGNAFHILKNQHLANLESLSRILNIKVGQVVSGTVLQANAVTPQTRQTLLNIYLEKQQSNTPITPPSNQNPVRSGAIKAEELTLLQSPKLQLVHVQVKQQQVLSFSDIPLEKNQPVQLQLKSANQLVILNPTKIDQQSPQAKSSLTQTYLNTENLNTIKTTSQTSAPDQTKKIANNITLQQALRSSVPQQTLPHQTFQGQQLSQALLAVVQLNQLTEKVGFYSAQTLIPKTLQEALKTAATHLRTPVQLSNPKILKQTLQNSGVQLEAKLKQIINKPDLSTNQVSQNSTQPQQLPQQDLKAALLLLLNRTQQHLPESTSNLRPSTANQNTTQNTLLIILKNLLQGTPDLAKVKQDIPREALIQQLQQLVQQALGKIQYQQLLSLSRRATSSSESSLLTNHNWQLEIPVRYGSDISPLHLQIDEQWVQQRQESNEKESDQESQKKRKWFIKLSFELPDAGFFYAQLSIIDDTLNASLWAEKPETLRKAQHQLGELKTRLNQAGVTVKSLDCFPGEPTLQNNRLSYSLVDIKT